MGGNTRLARTLKEPAAGATVRRARQHLLQDHLPAQYDDEYLLRIFQKVLSYIHVTRSSGFSVLYSI